MLDALLRLVDKSLVLAEPGGGGETRYRLLETVRQYGRERLLEAGEAEAARGRHRAWCLALAERAGAGTGTAPARSTWLGRLDAEHDNLRAALERSRDEPDGADRELRLAVALGRFWQAPRLPERGAGLAGGRAGAPRAGVGDRWGNR